MNKSEILNVKYLDPMREFSLRQSKHKNISKITLSSLMEEAIDILWERNNDGV